jgi:hypothetical protein
MLLAFERSFFVVFAGTTEGGYHGPEAVGQGRLHSPSVRIRSSQAFSWSTFFAHATPEWTSSAFEALVMMLRGRIGESTGGRNMMGI